MRPGTSALRRTRTWWAVGVAAALATATLVAPAQAAGPAATAERAKPKPTLKVMTQNVYLGSSLTSAESATNGTEFLAAVAEIYQTVQATDFPTRAKAIADSIAAQKPDLIGLQEVSKWTTVRVNMGPDLPQYDFLSILQSELAARGMRYRVAAVANNALISAPYVNPDLNCVKALPPDCAVTLLDRDVILVNTATRGLVANQAKTGRYKTQASLPTPLGPVSFDRGWASVEVTYKGVRFRFVNTHLEVEGTPTIQQAQGKEFLAGPAKSRGTVIATGDFNSAADGSTTTTYRDLTRRYFTDAWRTSRDGAGLSCCQNSTLSNPTSELKTRIDLVLAKGAARSTKAVLIGATTFRTTPPPLWPSDHAGVLATIRIG